MKKVIELKSISTSAVAQVLGTKTRKVRRLIHGKLVNARKLRNKWQMTILDAVVAAVMLLLLKAGLSFAEMEKAIADSGCYFPDECPPEAVHYVCRKRDPGKLARYLDVTWYDTCVLIHGRIGSPKVRMEICPEELTPDISQESRVRTTIILVRPLYESIRRERAKSMGLRPLGALPETPVRIIKKRPVGLGPVVSNKIPQHISSSRANVTVKNVQSNLRLPVPATEQVKEAYLLPAGKNPNEAKRLSIVDTLTKALEIARDPRVARQHDRVAELGSLVEDCDALALMIASSLIRGSAG
ncbi:MAG: hypothetical protein ACLP5H_34035 [Desulfomonilaceae bacterium]